MRKVREMRKVRIENFLIKSKQLIRSALPLV